jgi:hypothetical protein
MEIQHNMTLRYAINNPTLFAENQTHLAHREDHLQEIVTKINKALEIYN